MKREIRERVYKKFSGHCAYCGEKIEYKAMQVDHVIPQIRFKNGWPGDPDDIDNLMPVAKIINHYKGALELKVFKSWYLAGLHKRLAKLPINPRTDKSKKKK